MLCVAGDTAPPPLLIFRKVLPEGTANKGLRVCRLAGEDRLLSQQHSDGRGPRSGGRLWGECRTGCTIKHSAQVPLYPYAIDGRSLACSGDQKVKQWKFILFLELLFAQVL
jgi:hypothetical protein